MRSAGTRAPRPSGMSSTTPTMVQVVAESRAGSRTRSPTGSSPPARRRTHSRLTTATGGASASSAGDRARPCCTSTSNRSSQPDPTAPHIVGRAASPVASTPTTSTEDAGSKNPGAESPTATRAEGAAASSRVSSSRRSTPRSAADRATSGARSSVAITTSSTGRSPPKLDAEPIARDASPAATSAAHDSASWAVVRIRAVHPSRPAPPAAPRFRTLCRSSRRTRRIGTIPATRAVPSTSASTKRITGPSTCMRIQ